ncbi:hypothetical protein L1987_12279 [Smallanthus sonchifolius]|uniref:Uncharacterized protein n=1 Tax=Smallanthus sonchifolius TaxID=185202 RepID=A0ACB9JGS6_9ASTR|nr:hypothetical protein L1987_12279 [Smallanthus sonchifolius]
MLTEFRFFSFDKFVLLLGGIGPAGHSPDNLYVLDLTNDKYKWHMALEDMDSSPPCMADDFRCMGKAARAALSAIARHLRLRSDHCKREKVPLVVGTYQQIMKVKRDYAPGLQVRDPNGRWYLADNGYAPGELLLLTGKALSHATAGLRPAASYRAATDYTPATANSGRSSLAFRLMPQEVEDFLLIVTKEHGCPPDDGSSQRVSSSLKTLEKMEIEVREESRELNNNVMCQLADPEGNQLGASMYLPQSVGPKELQQMVNKLLNNVKIMNEEKLPYAFYISDKELVVQLVDYLQKHKVSVEKAVTIVYEPQAVFRIRPVNRCSSTIAGHTEAVHPWHKNWVLCIAWSPDGKHLVCGSKSGELQCWDPLTGRASGNLLTGHKKWITGISWEPVHLRSPCRRFVSSSKDGDARIWDVTLRKSVICLSGHTLAVTCVKWGGDGFIYTGSQDCTIKVWETTQGKLIRELKGHGHWVNSLALSTEYVLRIGAVDHTRKQYSSLEEMKKKDTTK